MASNINFTDINELYPVAGQDNDSQGFRDNFNLIKGGLNTASTEISALQTSTVKKDNTGGQDDCESFSGNLVKQVNFIEVTEEPYISDTIDTATYTVNWVNGHYQMIDLDGAELSAGITVTVADNWPASGKLGKVRLGFTTTGGAVPVTLSVGGGSVIKINGFASSNPVLSANGNDPYFVDVWTTNAGLTVYAQALGSFA